METLRGYLRYKPEMSFTNSMIAVCNFTIYDMPDKAYNVKTKVVAWEKLAEECHNKLTDCDHLFIKGYYKPNTWTDKEGNQVLENQLVAKQIWVEEKEGELIDLTVESYRSYW